MVRVLHIFPSLFGKSFSGHSKRWVRQFQNWDDPRVKHFILVVNEGKIIDANLVNDAFGSFSYGLFDYSTYRAKIISIFHTIWYLISHKHEYDLVHAHTHEWGSLLAAPLCRLLHRGSLREIVRIGSDDPSTLSKTSLSWLKMWCFHKFQRILCISEALKIDCLNNGFKETEVFVLHNPVDSNIFAPPLSLEDKNQVRQKLLLPENALILLFVGSVIRRKGVDVLIDAYNSLVADYPELYLVIVGPYSQKESAGVDEVFVENLRHKISSSDLSDRVRFTGRVDDDNKLGEYYRASDIFVFPTRQEGLGNVLLEAMASGLPCIASYLPQITDCVISDGENGILVEPENTQVLIENIRVLVEDRELRRIIGNAARNTAIENFTFNAYQSELINIYHQISGIPDAILHKSAEML